MAELFTEAELRDYLVAEVAAAGGARAWLRKNKMTHRTQINHMVANGDAATLADFLEVLGFRRVTRYEPVPPRKR